MEGTGMVSSPVSLPEATESAAVAYRVATFQPNSVGTDGFYPTFERLPMTSIYTETRSSFDSQQFWSRFLPFGAEGGISAQSDSLALVSLTADGVDLNVIWDEVQQIVAAWNAARDALTAVLSYATTNVAEAIPQSRSLDDFEPASEFGQPEAIRPPADYTLMAFTFSDYDKAARWSRRALRDQTADQVRATLNYALEADNRLCNSAILNRLFSPAEEFNEQGMTCWGLYNGDTTVPPPYLGRTFAAGHQHYLASQNEVIDSSDIETLAKQCLEHGYGADPGSQLLLFVNPTEADEISQFKAGVISNNGIVAKHSFIPSAGAPAYFSPEEIVGQVAPATYENLKISGSYGLLWIVESDYIPEHYATCVATYGANSPANAIGFRQHPSPVYQGFRTIPGNSEYPILDAFYTRAFGVGTRRRGQAAVVQITTDTTYTPPTIPGYVAP
jgi:hypothetical protein